ncbi:MAG: glycosyltransferase family 2 protein [Gammaproteobacteria bacterium]|nr:glycosyltransferase family 2 protein [Gammaproteobacteria bacterium]
MNNISVFLVVKNEAHNIERVLKSVQDFDDIVVVDSDSTDNTMELAAHYTDRLYNHEWQGMAVQKEYAKSLCKHDWVLNLDADEELTSELKQQIVDLVKTNNDIAGADIPIQEFFMGLPGHSAARMNSHIRLFRQTKAKYGSERFHESAVVNGVVTPLTGQINHYGETSIEVKVAKTNTYSSGKALDKFERGKHSHLLKLVVIFPLMFVKSYFIRRNFLNGRRGFIGSMVNAFYAFLKEAKLYEFEVKRSIK